MARNVLGSLASKVASSATMGVSNSQTIQRITDNVNLGSVLDSAMPGTVAERIQEKAFANVIEYEGSNDVFIWKHPLEDFNTGSQLIVHESQEAVFFMNGQALDLFRSGRYTLETENLPLVGRFFKAPLGGVTPFHCEVYFVNKTEQLSIKWGTDSKLEYVEPKYGFPIQIGASGEMSLRVEDSRKLLVKVVGTERGITQQSFVQKMRAFLVVHLKNYLATYIKQKKINIFEIDEHLREISDVLREHVKPDFSDYGMSLERFIVTTIVKPEGDGNYQRFKELHFRQYADVAEARLRQQTGVIDQETEAQRMVIEAQGIAQKRAIEGFTYQEERSFDVAEGFAANEAVAPLANMGVGMGMMVGVGGAVGAQVGGIMQNAMDAINTPGTPSEGITTESLAVICGKCGMSVPSTSKFCLECGYPVLRENEAICSSCGTKTTKSKFCSECGKPMIKSCSECGAELPPSGKFCAECGHKI